MLRYYYLTWFSQPAADRIVYQAVHPRQLGSIVEIGLGQGIRTKRLFELAVKPEHAREPLVYTGIDLFEARPKHQPGLSLKQAYRTLQTEHVRLRLTPGDPLSALGRMANTIGPVDLIVISADQEASSMAAAWRYVPRIMHGETLVYLERSAAKGQESKFELLTVGDVEKLASVSHRAARHAA